MQWDKRYVLIDTEVSIIRFVLAKFLKCKSMSINTTTRGLFKGGYSMWVDRQGSNSMIQYIC